MAAVVAASRKHCAREQQEQTGDCPGFFHPLSLADVDASLSLPAVHVKWSCRCSYWRESGGRRFCRVRAKPLSAGLLLAVMQWTTRRKTQDRARAQCRPPRTPERRAHRRSESMPEPGRERRGSARACAFEHRKMTRRRRTYSFPFQIISDGFRSRSSFVLPGKHADATEDRLAGQVPCGFDCGMVSRNGGRCARRLHRP